MSLLENLLNIFFIEEKSEEDSCEISNNKIDLLQDKIKNIEIEIKQVEEQEDKQEQKSLQEPKEPQEEEQQLEEQQQQEEPQEKEQLEEQPKEQQQQQEKEQEQQQEENIKIEVQQKKKEKKKLKTKLQELKEELKQELRKEFFNNEEKKTEESKKSEEKNKQKLNLHIYNDYKQLLLSLKDLSLLILNDAEQKRELKKFLIENNINNIMIISNLKDLKKKMTNIPDIKNVIIDGNMFENNKETILEVLNLEGSIQYSIYYSLEEYKKIIKTFSVLSDFKITTNKTIFKRSKFQEIMKKLKILEEDILLV